MLVIREEQAELVTRPVLECPNCHAPIALSTIGKKWTIHAPRDIAEHLIPTMGSLEKEELHILVLNTRNIVLADMRVYQGNISSNIVRVGELFKEAVRRNAAGIIIVHNHPSGDPTPSPDDLSLTAEVIAAGRLLDIQVLDHLIIASDTFVSLRDRGIQFDR